MELRYDPAVVDFADLLRAGEKRECASKVFALSDEQLETARELVGEAAVRAERSSFRPDKATKHYLKQSLYRFVPMTALQAQHVNAALGKRQGVKGLLSPRQVTLAERIRRTPKAKWPPALGVDIARAWQAANAVATAPK